MLIMDDMVSADSAQFIFIIQNLIVFSGSALREPDFYRHQKRKKTRTDNNILPKSIIWKGRTTANA